MEAEAVKERPIIFKGEMVRAILEGRKTQTRRLIKPQPEIVGDHVITCLHWKGENYGSIRGNAQDAMKTQSPYGQVGDRLWVRETWAKYPNAMRIAYKADMTAHIRTLVPDAFLPQPVTDIPKWKPSIHMPRWASRITLEITEVRVERVQEINAHDAVVEGIFWGVSLCQSDTGYDKAVIDKFHELWDSIHGSNAWERNDWVWVISFKRIQ